jgi:hypothetical protein
MSEPFTQLRSLAQNENPNIRSISKRAIKYRDALQSGSINLREYNDLMLELQRTNIVAKTADDLKFKQMLSSCLQAAINIGSTLI